MRDKESHTDIKIDNVENNGTGLLDKLIVENTELLEAYDFKNLRSNPLHKISDDTFRIISPQFVIELLYNGLYWQLKNICNNLAGDQRPKKDLYHLKTLEFSEQFALNSLLRKIYGNRYIQKSGEELDLLYDGAPDYYVRNGNKIFIFESKDIMLSAESKQSFDFNVINEELKTKLFQNEKGKSKAVLQIISNVKKILREKKLDYDKGYKLKNIKVYPILVLHYRMFNVGGLNKIINSWFQNELSNIKNTEGLDVSRVQPLIIIDIDTLIFYQDLFGNRKLDLEKCLDNYIENYLNFGTQKASRIRNPEIRLQALKDSLLPFAVSLDILADKKGLRAVPSDVLLKAYGLFDDENNIVAN